VPQSAFVRLAKLALTPCNRTLFSDLRDNGWHSPGLIPGSLNLSELTVARKMNIVTIVCPIDVRRSPLERSRL